MTPWKLFHPLCASCRNVCVCVYTQVYFHKHTFSPQTAHPKSMITVNLQTLEVQHYSLHIFQRDKNLSISMFWSQEIMATLWLDKRDSLVEFSSCGSFVHGTIGPKRAKSYLIISWQFLLKISSFSFLSLNISFLQPLGVRFVC